MEALQPGELLVLVDLLAAEAVAQQPSAGVIVDRVPVVGSEEREREVVEALSRLRG